MNEFRIRTTSAIISEAELRAKFQNVMLPAVLDKETLSELDADVVLNSPQPPANAHQQVYRAGAVKDTAGNWVQAWKVADFKPEDIKTNQAASKITRWKDIQAERDRRILSSGYKVGEKWFHSDQLSRTQQLGLAMMGTKIPADLQWKTMDGSFILMTPALAADIFAAAAARDIAIFTAAEKHKAAMEASEFPQNYDFSAGWPVPYTPA
jgi:hypothetical protein